MHSRPSKRSIRADRALYASATNTQCDVIQLPTVVLSSSLFIFKAVPPRVIHYRLFKCRNRSVYTTRTAARDVFSFAGADLVVLLVHVRCRYGQLWYSSVCISSRSSRRSVYFAKGILRNDTALATMMQEVCRRVRT